MSSSFTFYFLSGHLFQLLSGSVRVQEAEKGAGTAASLRLAASIPFSDRRGSWGTGFPPGWLQVVVMGVFYLLTATTTLAQRITTVAGNGTAGYGGDATAATSAQFNQPTVAVMDGSGYLYIVDQLNHRIRKLSPGGVITTVVGTGISGYSGDGGAATAAQLNAPYGMTIDAGGNLFIADQGNHCIRKVSPGGTITTVAGSGTPGYGGDGGAATAAQLNAPCELTIDRAGNLLITDQGNQRIRKVSPSGIITTVVGNGTKGYSGDGATATSAQLDTPYGIAVDGSGSIYFTDQGNQRIRKVSSSGIITTIAGTGAQAYSGDGGAATSAKLNKPTGLALDGNGNLFIADKFNNRIRKINPQGIISTIAGIGLTGYAGDGDVATSAQFSGLAGLTVDGSGNLLIGDQLNNCIRKINTAGIISTVAGTGRRPGFSGDAVVAALAQLNNPYGLAVDGEGHLFFADQENNCIRRLSLEGFLTTVAGTPGLAGFSGDGGAATSAQLNGPAGIALDNSGNLYIADLGNYRVRMVNSAGIISTVAGDGTAGSGRDGMSATRSSLAFPVGVAVDGSGNLYIADLSSQRVRKVSPQGIITTVAGNGTPGYSGDGEAATAAQLNKPAAIALDGDGNLYIAVQGSQRIRKVNTQGIITTVAGTGVQGYSGDGGAATSAQLNRPNGVLVDGSGNLYISDWGSQRIRKVNLLGIISTVAGTGVAGYSGDGGIATAAQLNSPAGIALDGSGNLFISDQSNHVIRAVAPTPTLSLTPASLSALCAGSPLSLTAAASHFTPTSFTWTSKPAGFSASGATLVSTTPAVSVPTVYTLTVTASDGLQSPTASLTLTVNPNPTVTLLTSSSLISCASPTASFSALVGASPTVTQYSFRGGGIISSSPTSGTAQINKAGSYSVVVSTASGCSAVATTSIGSTTALAVSAGASLAVANVGVTISLTASGASSYQWKAPATAPLTTPASSGAVSASLSTAGVQTFTVVGSTGVCSQSALVSVTALTGADLSPTVLLPSSNFSAGETKGVLIQVQEVNGFVSSGAVFITVTLPTGYSVRFGQNLSSLQISGGGEVSVTNSKWQVSGVQEGQQLRLSLNNGESVGARSTLNVGVWVTRTSANGGSSSSMTVNVAEDSSGSYDVNRFNNVYARIISGL